MDAVVIGGVRIDHVLAANGCWAGPVLGGNALYAAAAMHLWGRDAALVTRVNEQLAPDALQPLADAGIDLRGIISIPGREGLHTYLRYLPDGEREGMTGREFCECTGAVLALGTDEGVQRYDDRYEQLHVAVSPTPAEMPRAYYAASLFLLMTMPWSSHRAFVSALEPAAGSILLDPYPTYMVKASDAALRELLQRVCVLLPSEVEVRSRFPDLDIPTGAQRLLDLGCGAVVVKLGAHGSLVLRREHRMVAVPAYQTLAKDPTGAGDAFMGGFAAGLLETGDLLEAALYGTVAASFAVQEFGLLHLLSVERQDAEHRLDALRRLRYSGTL